MAYVRKIEDCTALILAGGDSRRMGQDKAVLVLDGKTLLERITVTMQQIFPRVIVSVRQLRAGVEVQQVCDEYEASGPLAGLIAGLAQADTPWVFAVACDMPFVSAKVVEALAEYRSTPTPPNLSLCEHPLRGLPAYPAAGEELADRSLPDKGGLEWVGIQAVVPVVDGHPQPLAAFYATSALETMRASLAAGDRSLRGALEKLEVNYVGEAELRTADPQLRSFFDLDTPQDLAQATTIVPPFGKGGLGGA